MRMLAIAALMLMAVQTAYPQGRPWRGEVMLESEHGMGGAAIGDLDPESPGNEVVVVNTMGEVWMVSRAGDAWRPQPIQRGDGELIMCAIGDVDPRSPGNELVAVGMVSGPEAIIGPGQVVLVRRDAGAWKAGSIFTDERMIHGAAIGDVCSRHAGQEVVAAGFSHRFTLLCRDDEKWLPETIYVANDRLKIALAGDVMPERDGLDIRACGQTGQWSRCGPRRWAGGTKYYFGVPSGRAASQSGNPAC